MCHIADAHVKQKTPPPGGQTPTSSSKAPRVQSTDKLGVGKRGSGERICLLRSETGALDPSGRRFAGGDAADAARHVETVLGAAAILHPREDLRKTDPGFHTVDVGFERALETLEGADHVSPVGVKPPLACPQCRPASTPGKRAKRVKIEGGLCGSHALQHRKLLSMPCASNGSVTKSRMCRPATS